MCIEIWMAILAVFLVIIFKLKLYKNDKLFFYISVLTLFFAAPFVHFVVTQNTPFGFISNKHYDTWIGFYGSIIGGVLTVLGVWWTLDEQNKQREKDKVIRDQERKEELAIKYKPFLVLDHNKLNNFKHSFNAEGIIPIDLTRKPNKDLYIELPIENIGDGECYLYCYDNPFYFINEKKQVISNINIKKNSGLKKGFTTVIGRHKIANLAIIFNYDGSSKDFKEILDITIPLLYQDQFRYKTYKADINLLIQLSKGMNNENMSYYIEYSLILNKDLILMGKEENKMDKETYLQERLQEQINWYEKKASTAKKYHHRISIASIVISSLGSLITLLGLAFDFLEPWFTILSAFLGVTVASGLAIDKLKNYGDLFLKYRRTCESLKREKFLFQTNSGEYYNNQNSLNLLVERCESIMSTEVGNWAQ